MSAPLDPIDHSICRAIEARRLALDMSHTALAARTGISIEVINAALEARQAFTVSQLVHVTGALEMSIFDLLLDWGLA